MMGPWVAIIISFVLGFLAHWAWGFFSGTWTPSGTYMFYAFIVVQLLTVVSVAVVLVVRSLREDRNAQMMGMMMMNQRPQQQSFGTPLQNPTEEQAATLLAQQMMTMLLRQGQGGNTT